MTGLLKGLIGRLVTGQWGKILPLLLSACAEGKMGSPAKAIYWFLAGHKTFIGAIVFGAGVALENICVAYPDLAASCEYARWFYIVGGFLVSVGLADGGTRAPWPVAPGGKAPWQEGK